MLIMPKFKKVSLLYFSTVIYPSVIHQRPCPVINWHEIFPNPESIVYRAEKLR